MACLAPVLGVAAPLKGGPARAVGRLTADDFAVGARPLVVVHGEVPGGLVIPEDEGAWLPTESDGGVGRRRVREEEWQARLAIGRVDSGETDRRRAGEKTL